MGIRRTQLSLILQRQSTILWTSEGRNYHAFYNEEVQSCGHQKGATITDVLQRKVPSCGHQKGATITNVLQRKVQSCGHQKDANIIDFTTKSTILRTSEGRNYH